MADEVTRGQEKGEIARAGGDQRSINVQASDNGAGTLPEHGIKRQRLADWRTVRDAGEAVVETAIANALAEGRALAGILDLSSGAPLARPGTIPLPRRAAPSGEPFAPAPRAAPLPAVAPADAAHGVRIEAPGAQLRAVPAAEPMLGAGQAPGAPATRRAIGALNAGASRIEGAGERVAAGFPVDPKWANNPAVQAAKIAVGSAPMVVGAVLGGLPAAAAAAFSQTYSSTFRTERALGADRETVHAAAMANGMVGAGLMALPVGPAAAWLGELPVALKNRVLNFAADLAVNAGVMIGFGQLQQLADNIVARETYDPTRPITQ